MIIRNYCACNSCEKHYLIRYGVSDQFPQKASFFCDKCGEKLTYGYNKDRTNILGNLSVIQPDDLAQNINLHPELLIDKADQSDPTHFATLDFMTKQRKKGDENLTVLRKAQKSIIAYNNGWDLLAKDMRFLNEKRFELIDNKFGKKEDEVKKKIIKKVLEVSRLFIEGPWKKYYDEAISELEIIRRIPAFIDFKTFLKDKEDSFIRALYEIMNDFANIRTEMLVTLIAQKCEHPLAGNTSTAEWEKIEKVYGDLYERYGDLVVVLTGINNLKIRGAFDQFDTVGFTLQKYLDSDKANRCKNFESNPKLAAFGNYYEANIRNGTHHKNSRINKEKQEIILGVGKGGKNERIISFAEYISFCNELYAKCLIMLNIIFKVIYS